MSVGEDGNNGGADCTEGVYRDSQELGVCFRVSKAKDNTRCSVGKSIYRDSVSLSQSISLGPVLGEYKGTYPVDNNRKPNLPIEEYAQNRWPVELIL